VPLTISTHRPKNFYIEHDNKYFSFTDRHLIPSFNFNMSILSSSSTNFLNLLNSTTPGSESSTTIRPMTIVKALPVAFVLSSIVVLCICGNILVILSVFTFRPLRTVQNFFIVSLAFSDMLVAIIVMPFHIVTHILNRWIFGKSKKKPNSFEN
jgi:hypothetical protein